MALPDDRNTREYLTFTLDTDGNPTIRVKPISGGVGTLPDSLNDRWYQAFTTDSNGDPVLRVTPGAGSSFVLGSGTAGKLTRWTATDTIGAATVAESSGALSAITTLSMSGQLTSTLVTGTAPFVVASTTVVANLNASALGGATFAAPGAIGGGTPNTGAFTTMTATSLQAIIGNVTPAAGTFTTVTGNTSVTTPLLSTSASDLVVAPSTFITEHRTGTGAAAQVLRLYNTFTDTSNYERMSLEWSSNVSRLNYSQASGTGASRTFRISRTGSTVMEFGASANTVTVTGTADNVPWTVGGYSVTGSGTSSLASYSGTLNTSGVTHVNDWSITNTASGAGSTAFRIRTGAAGATAAFSISMTGATTATSFVGPTVGTTTNDNAATGNVGEIVTSEVAAGTVSFSTGTAADITSISLTAGDWDVNGNVTFSAAAGTIPTSLASWVSSTSATLPTAPNEGGENFLVATFGTGSNTNILTTGTKRFSLSGTTTVYLSGRAVFTVSTLTGGGYIRARRIR